MWDEVFVRKDWELSAPSFKRALGRTQGAVLVDVRTAAEYYFGTLPGAVNIDFMSKDFERRVKALSPDKTYFVFCRNGNRSRAASKIMRRNGLRVFRLHHGLNAWSQ